MNMKESLSLSLNDDRSLIIGSIYHIYGFANGRLHLLSEASCKRLDENHSDEMPCSLRFEIKSAQIHCSNEI